MVNNSFALLKELRYVALKLIIGKPFEGTKTWACLRNINEHCAFVSYIEPKSFLEAKKYTNWILAMQDKIN